MKSTKGMLAWTLLVGGSLALQPPTQRAHARRRGVRMAVTGPGPGGGDLSGGADAERNAQLAALKKAFYAAPSPDGAASEAAPSPSEAAVAVVDPGAAEDAARLGLLLDTPLCRWSFVILPHSQAQLNVWQPQYTLMFEKLLASEPPHYYVHLLLPGGTDSLADPAFDLRPGSEAPLAGTLMRIVYARREADSRLTLLVQGLARCEVVRPTQTLPYSRADVQILPDEESLLDAARAADRFLDQSGAPAAAVATAAALRRRLTMAAAAKEAEHFFDYEAGAVTLGKDGDIAPLNQLNGSVAHATMATAAEAKLAALRDAPMAPSCCYRPRGWVRAAPKDEFEEDDEIEADDLYLDSRVLDMLTAVVTAVEESAEAETPEEAAAEELEALGLLEVQVWLELDDLLNLIRSLSSSTLQRVPVPSQMLGLLPPPPAAGWPPSFRLAEVSSQLRERYEALQSRGEMETRDESGDAVIAALGYVPADASYPLRKRAERLSWVIWTVIGSQAVGVNVRERSPLQALLEVDSTSERLRMALLRLRELKRKLTADGGSS